MDTRRLYYDDSSLLVFDAEVLAVTAEGEPSRVVLDQSAFYPESGGQLADHGRLGDGQIVDVQVEAGGVVEHHLTGTPPAVGERVQGQVDWPRRRLHRALHTGQHMLSRALLDELGQETRSSRLGDRTCTIDLAASELSAVGLDRVECKVNEAIDDDRPVRAFFPPEEDLAKYELRRAPKVTEGIRLVQVEGFDVTPCGGTHVQSTAQIGQLWITQVERYKGGSRVHFAAGTRARELMRRESAALRALGRSFKGRPLDVPDGVEKLRRELEEARVDLGQLRAEAATRVAGQLRERLADGALLIECLEGMSADVLRSVAGRVVEGRAAAAVLGARSADGIAVIVIRGPGSELPCGKVLAALAAATGGRGGGRPERAEGRLPPVEDFVAQAEAAIAGLSG